MYIYLSSDDSLDIYPKNSPGSFYSKFCLPITGKWEIALLQLQYINSYIQNIPPKNLYICCDICNESYLSNMKLPILRRIFNTSSQSGETVEAEISNLIHVSNRCNYFDVIRIYILDENARPVIFSEGPLLLTLHLKEA